MLKRKAELYAVMAIVALAIMSIWTMSGTGCSWFRANGGTNTAATLEEKGEMVRLGAQSAITEIYNQKPGPWIDEVCTLSGIVCKALDGDEAALQALGLLGTDPVAAKGIAEDPPTQSTITLQTKTFLLNMLTAIAERYQLDPVWTSRMNLAVGLIDLYLISSVSMEHDLWFLTRSFFQGIADGCKTIGGK